MEPIDFKTSGASGDLHGVAQDINLTLIAGGVWRQSHKRGRYQASLDDSVSNTDSESVKEVAKVVSARLTLANIADDLTQDSILQSWSDDLFMSNIEKLMFANMIWPCKAAVAITNRRARLEGLAFLSGSDNEWFRVIVYWKIESNEERARDQHAKLEDDENDAGFEVAKESAPAKRAYWDPRDATFFRHPKHLAGVCTSV